MAKGGTKIDARQIANPNNQKSNIIDNASYKMSEETDIEQFSEEIKALSDSISEFSDAVDKFSSANKSKSVSENIPKKKSKEPNKSQTNNTNTAKILASIRDDVHDMSDSVSGGLLDAVKSSFGDGSSGGIMDALNEATGGILGKVQEGLKAAMAVMNTISNTLNSINGIFEGGIQQAISDQSAYLSQINTRLYGSGEDTENYYNEIVARMTQAFGDNSFVSQQKLLKNIADAVSRGIEFNYEERAYLETIAEKTVSTFDAFDKSLTQLIRIQQVDTTITAMGGEGLLTKFLNSTFEDTSYLTDLFDSINAVILDAMTQFDDYALAQDFQFAVQSWLGSLYSVGVDSNTITKIAQGLNYLGTGNVTALGNDSALQNLLVMAATNAGLSYSDLLTSGLDADTVNDLMSSMVDYLQDIAYNTNSNEVVKSAWTSITGVSVSDLRAIQNLQQEDINAIKTQVSDLSYVNNLEEANHQIELMTNTDDGGLRVGTAERVETGVNNFLYAIGQNLTTDSDLYARYYKAEFVQGMVDSLAGSFGLLGDVTSSVVGLISAIQETSAISEAINTTMQGLQRNIIEVDDEVLGQTEALNTNTQATTTNTTATEDTSESNSALQKTVVDNVYKLAYRMGTSGSEHVAYIQTFDEDAVNEMLKENQEAMINGGASDLLNQVTLVNIQDTSDAGTYYSKRLTLDSSGSYDRISDDNDTDNTIVFFTNGSTTAATDENNHSYANIVPGDSSDIKYNAIIGGYRFVDENGNALSAEQIDTYNYKQATTDGYLFQSVANLIQTAAIDHFKNVEIDDTEDIAETIGKEMQTASENGEMTNISNYGIISALTNMLGIAFGDTIGLTTLNPYETTRHATARGEAFYGLDNNVGAGEVASGLSYSTANLDSASNTLSKTAAALESTYTEISGVEEVEQERTTTDIYNTTDNIYNEVQSFSGSQDVIAVNTSTALDYQQSTNNYIQKLYTAIFENQQAINVSLSNITDDVYSKLVEYLGVNVIKSIESILLNDSIKVKAETSNTDYFNTITSIRGAY